MQQTLLVLDETITAAQAANVPASGGPFNVKPETLTSLGVAFTFDYGSGGTSIDVYLQTSLDGGLSWMDIAELSVATTSLKRCYNLTPAAVTAIATPTDGSLTANTSVNGHLGAMYRVKIVTVGTYAAGTRIRAWLTPRA